MPDASKLAARVTALILLPFAAAACSGADTAATWAGTVSDSAGIQVVHNPVEGTWGPGEAWGLEEVLSIGEMLGEPEYQFGQIVSVDTDVEGNVYIADIQAQEVRVFDSEGVYKSTIGGPGAGPGEIGLGLSGVFALPDEVFVADIGNGRINRYAYDGEVLGSDLVDLTEGVPIRWDRIGDAVVAQLRVMSTDDETDPTGDVIVRMGGQGEGRETIGNLPVGRSLQFVNGQPPVRVFEAEPIWDASADGRIIMAVNSSLRIEVRDAEGALVRVITRPHEVKEVTERDQRIVLAALRRQFEQLGVPASAVERVIARFQFADTYPAFATLTHGPRGSVWVQRIRSGDELSDEGDFDPQDLGSDTWDIFDSEGRYLGEVSFPGKYQPIKVIGDRIYGIARDELDVQSMKVYRVVME